MKLFIYIGFLGALFGSSCRTVKPIASTSISVKKFGAKGNGKSDDTEAIIKAFNTVLQSNEVNELFFPKGKYILKKPLFKGVIKKDIIIRGEKSELICSQYVGQFSAEILFSEELNFNLKRGSKVIQYDHGGNIKQGNILTIFSNLPGEKSWGYKKSDIHTISSIKEGRVLIDAPLNFNYTKGEERITITAYQKQKIVFKSLKFTFRDKNSWKSKLCVRLDGLSAAFTDINVDNQTKMSGGSLIGLYNCVNVDFTNLRLHKALYGVLINNSRNITANNVFATEMNHPLVPATWSTNLSFKKLRGKNIAVDAHPSFNVTYEDVDINMGKSYFNCRAIGLKLKDCRFVADKSFLEGSVYIGASNMTEEVTPILKEYEIVLDNVFWVHPLKGFNGLSIIEGHNITIKNCTTHSVFIGRRCSNILVEDSALGKFTINEGTFTLKNIQFRGQLLSKGITNSPLTFSWSGSAVIEGCCFSGYDSQQTYLISLMNSSKSSIVSFKNCQIIGFKGLVKKISEPDKFYNGLTFENSELKNIREFFCTQILNKEGALKNCILKNVPENLKDKNER